MPIPPLEFDLCDMVVAAINSAKETVGEFPLRLIPEVDPTAEFELELRKGVHCLVTPATTKTMPETLDGGNEELCDISVFVSGKPKTADLKSARVMLQIVRTVWAAIETNVDANLANSVSRTADPLYDHDKYRKEGVFESECIFTFRCQRQEDFSSL